ncbi:universal stress protein [Massilia yuzhufengensis]|uniref:Nucleotide-binding universal stress protein, UspA family n=1 Tax=Massilia yuzhufengensis TaxID=1164594 RepID=A0A1I1LLT1_9BURK|nr:universal stress protein [Massilia yuzhufengensis]SFC71938.1 Nucleotide-binding universal stress protein, UspA family [Massilia yuzhufengensis]
MNDSTPALPPQRLLLATDLCARCDRPLERAKQLAREWQTGLAVLTVRDGPQTPDEVASWLDGDQRVPAFELAARRELAEEFAGSGVAPTLQVAEGDVADGIRATAAAMQDALVVMGASRNDSFQELILGSTAERLSQDLPQPLLVVRRRTRGSYQRILVANDFSEAARRALETAAAFFPGRRITLFHALEGSAGAAGEVAADAVQDALARSELFLDACTLPGGARARIAPVIGHGRVTEAVTRHVQDQAIELAVLGVHRHSGMARVFMGTRSSDLLQHLACDTLLVRAADG